MLALDSTNRSIPVFQEAQTALASSPPSQALARLYSLISTNYEKKGRYKEALEWQKRLTAISTDFPATVARPTASGQEPPGTLPGAQRTDDYLFWFLALLALGIAAAVFFIHKTRKLTEALKLQAEAAQLLASKDREFAMQREQLYVNVTHELRTPLTLVISPLEEIVKENPHPQLLVSLKYARELLYRFNDILKWNKLEAQAAAPNWLAGDIVDELEKIIGQLQPPAHDKGIQLSLAHIGPRKLGEMDFDKLSTIVTNLVVNAIKFTEKGGLVEVQLDTTGPQTLKITVLDTGRGIPEAALPHLFDRFYQTTNQANALQSGSGIGLALAKRLTDLLEGSLTVASEVGKGTSFELVLPFREAGKQTVAHEFEQPKTGEAAETTALDGLESILVVEDHHELRSFIAGALSSQYHLLEASEVPAAIGLAQENLPDAILTDVMLPNGQTGIDLCHALKNSPLTSHIPVLVLTAHSDYEVKKSALEAGADAFLTKPFSIEELALTLKNLMANRKRFQEKLSTTIQQSWTGQDAGKPELDPFLETVLQTIQSHLDDSGFGVEQLADNMRISRVQLFKKVKSLTGVPPADLLRTIRLEKARHLLATGVGNVSAIAYMTGFDNPNYFSKAFKKHFGLLPSDVLLGNLN